MKMIFKISTVVLVIACILLTVGCKKKKVDYQGPVGLPSDSIINSDGEVVEDEITVDDLLGIESDKTDTTSKDESDKNNTSNNSSTNKDESSKNETSSDKNDTENSNTNEENSSNTSSGNSSSNKNDVVSEKEENNGFKDDLGWF
ncbi:MAG: hypothetical protein IKV81_04380 [Clostridia bacterium]|nr:hypothetical protein [Clostridia bacterium]